MLLLLLLRLLLATTITTASSSSNSQLFFFISNYLKPRPQGAKLAPSISHFYVHKMLKYGFLLFFGSSDSVEANFHFHYFNRLLTHNFLEEIVAIECLECLHI